MGWKNFVNNTFVPSVLKSASDEAFNIEAASRGNGGSKGLNLSGKIVKQPNIFRAKTIKDWTSAVALATDPDNPSLLLLDELYEILLLDAHAVSVIESRVLKVTRSKFNILDVSGAPNEELETLLNRPWFDQFLKHAAWSLFTGVKVIELYDTDQDGELIRSTSIPMAHLLPHKCEISKEPGDDKGTSYDKGSLANYYIQVGEADEIGMLSDIATLILAKKQAMGAWLDNIEKFGVPPIIINTDNFDKNRQQELLDMGVAMHNNHVMVTQGGETFTIGNVKETDAHKVFHEFLKYIDSAISKRILGQDGTTENKEGAGTYGSLQVMQEVANDRHESDKVMIEYLINKVLLPKLPLISNFYSALGNATFAWDESDEMDPNTLLDKAVSLTTAGYTLDYEILATKTGMPITGFVAPFSNTPPEEQKEKK